MKRDMFKKNLIALLCAAVMGVALLLPALLQGQVAPSKAASAVTWEQVVSSYSAQEQGESNKDSSEPEVVTAPVVADEQSGGNPPQEPEYVPGEILVGLADGVTVEQLNEQLDSMDYVVTRTVSDDDVTFGYVKLDLVDGVSVEDAAMRVAGDPLFKAAQPNYVYYVQDDSAEDAEHFSAGLQVGEVEEGVLAGQSTVINDAYRSKQWALKAVHAYEAWDTVRVNGSVVVAVLDSGVDTDHEDFQGRLLRGYNAIDGSADVADTYGHGTHVAGIIAATANNGVGVAGVSYNATILPVKVMNGNSASTSDLAKGMNYVASLPNTDVPRVMNISIGSSGTVARDSVLDQAIQTVHSKGILIVYAGANKDGGTTSAWDSYPCDFDLNAAGTGNHPESIGVINVDSSDQRASSSNFNMNGKRTKTLSAPGTGIYSTWHTGDYHSLGGTSMAAPCVAGVAALVFAANPNLSAAEVKTILEETARDLGPTGWDNETGYGMVDAEAAVKKAVSRPGAVASLGPTLSGPYSTRISEKITLTVGNGGSGTWTWESSDAGIAVVTGSGATAVVTGVSEGTVSITARSGDIELVREIVVGHLPIARAELSQSTYIYDGKKHVPEVYVYGIKNGVPDQRLKIDVDYIVEQTSDCTNPGSHTLTVRGTGDYRGDVPVKMTISKDSIARVDVSPSTFVYDGNGHVPTTVTVTGASGRQLVRGVDYSLDGLYERTNAGPYYFTVTPIGYCGGSSVQKSFKIEERSLKDATVTLSYYSCYSDGSAKKPTVTVTLNGRRLTQNVDYRVSYSNNVNAGTATVHITPGSSGNYKDSCTARFTILMTDAQKAHGVKYSTHVQNVGWQSNAYNGATAGTSGKSLRLEGIRISLTDKPYSGSIRYRTHVQNIGWETGWTYNGATSGTSGRALRLEAIQIELTDEMAQHYDVYYRVHAQNVGWMGWAKNGESAGTAGYGYRLEAIQIVLMPKGSGAPQTSPPNAFSGAFKADQIQYRTHVQNDGWQSYVGDGAMSGTSGRSLRLEGINIRLGSQSGLSGGVQYRTHVQSIGWERDWKSNGAMSGTSGRALRLEAIQIQLTGDVATKYDVYYRVHCQNFGWMGWAKNGESAGSAGFAYRLEGIEIRLVPKGGSAPGSTYGAFRQR